MLESLGGLVVLAADEIPPDSIMAQLIVPIGVLAFLGSTYLLLRSNLGTRRAYYVLGTVLFGFMLIMSLFWGFGAPGTPQTTGPQNLPGQPPDALIPKWIPFAQDSLLAEREDLSIVSQHPEGFEVDGWPADFDEEADRGVESITNFFSSDDAGQQIEATWPVEEVAYARTSTGYPVLAVTYQAVDDQLQPIEGETYLAFAFFDAGFPLLPSLIFVGLSLVLFVLHAWLLDRDERMERRREAAAREAAAPEQPRVPAGAR